MQVLHDRVQQFRQDLAETAALQRYIEECWGESLPIPQWEMPDTDSQKEYGV
jgi:hypothetical protein